MRHIVFDTETTGLNALGGDRVIEIGAIELKNYLPTGKTFHKYINPDNKVITADAEAVHGITSEFLKDKPFFEEIAKEFLEFIEDANLIAHNSSFDAGFINMELKKAGFEQIPNDRFINTLEIARRKFPGAKNNLDALCARFNIDNSKRTKHGALLDAELLAEVYLELVGGNQPGLNLDISLKNSSDEKIEFGSKKERPKRSFDISPSEAAAHEKLVSENPNCLWASLPD